MKFSQLATNRNQNLCGALQTIPLSISPLITSNKFYTPAFSQDIDKTLKLKKSSVKTQLNQKDLYPLCITSRSKWPWTQSSMLPNLESGAMLAT